MEVLLLITLLIAVSAEWNVEEATSNDISSAVMELIKKVNEQNKRIDSLQSEITSCKKTVGSLTKEFDLVKKASKTTEESLKVQVERCKKDVGVLKKAVATLFPAGKTQISSVKSCKWLQENYDNLGSGLYWVSLKEPTQVYCDMRKKYDGGGWIMIGQMEVKSQSEAKDVDFYKILSNSISNLRDTQTKRFLLSSQGLRELQGYINFTQIRFYCRKAWHGRTLHIQTSKNDLGRGVVDLMTENSEKEPKACASYERFSDDNSILSARCDQWLGEKWFNQGNKNMKMYSYPMSSYDRYFSLYPDYLECDDNTQVHSFTPVGEWAFYVR